MLEYVQLIMEKVSFDKTLFEKELQKSLKALRPEEVTEFKRWCYENFDRTHAQALQKCFKQQAAEVAVASA